MANGCWWRVCENLNELFEHHEATNRRYSNALLEEAYDNDNKYQNIRDTARLYGRNNNTSFAGGLAMLSAICFKSQADAIKNNNPIWINENGGWNTGLTPTATIYMQKIIYPNYTKKDIRISKFGPYGKGQHYYAHIGEIEVCAYNDDNDKIIKWDTYEEAYQNALRYCAELD